MDRLQFNGWHLDGWMASYSQNFFNGIPTMDIRFDVVEGNLRNGDERIWFIPDSSVLLGIREFQGSIVNFNMTVETPMVREIGLPVGIQRNWGLPERKLYLRITDIVYPDGPEFDIDFVNRDYEQINEVINQIRTLDPDAEKQLTLQQIERETQIAKQQQEEIDYKNLPSRLDSID